MSKYDQLWKYIEEKRQTPLTLSFDEIGEIAGVPLDHSFLRYKKELLSYGFEVDKISLKNKVVKFCELKK